MTETMRTCAILLAVMGAAACQEDAEPVLDDGPSGPFEGAAGSPPAWIEEEVSVAFEEAEPLDTLMARGPKAREIEPPVDLVIDKKIVRNDNRIRVSHTRKAPYSSVAMLIMTFPNTAAPGLCTGSMIASDAVLTAAHCVFDPRLGGFATSMRVVPGAHPDADGVTQQPFGSASALRAFAPDAYRSANKFWDREPHDYAVVRIGPGLKGAYVKRTYGVAVSPSVARPIKLVGYHVDKCFGKAECEPGSSSFTMHISNDQIREVLPGGNQEPMLFNHYADTVAGSSGSPIISDGAEANTIFALHVAGFRGPAENTWNMGVLLTPKAVKSIESWAKRAL